MLIDQLSKLLIGYAWLAIIWVWIAMSFRGKQVARRESPASRLAHIVPLAVALALMVFGRRLGPLAAPIMPRAAWMAPTGAIVTWLGLGLATWARLKLGRNWSGTVTVKQNHELIRSGPYRLTRHPIYTGLLTSLLATALAIDCWYAALAFVIVTLSFLRKMRTEEAFMQAEFGDAYTAYRREVPALIPFLISPTTGRRGLR